DHKMACRRGEYAMSSRSISSSSWTPTITATGLPFRVTTTGPAALALRKELNCDLISATDAIFIIPSPRRQRLDPFSCSLWSGRRGQLSNSMASRLHDDERSLQFLLSVKRQDPFQLCMHGSLSRG